MKNSYDIIIIGGGIVGVSAAYYASLENLRVLLIEKDSIASHASGFAYGGITPHVGLEENDPYNQISQYSYNLHKSLAEEIPELSGIDYGYRSYPNFELAMNDKEEEELEEIYSKYSDQNIYEYFSKKELNKIEPRLGPKIRSSLVTKISSGVEPYKLTLALGTSSEKNGVEILNSEVNDINIEKRGTNEIIVAQTAEILNTLSKDANEVKEFTNKVKDDLTIDLLAQFSEALRKKYKITINDDVIDQLN